MNLKKIKNPSSPLFTNSHAFPQPSRPSDSSPLHSLPSFDRLFEVVGFNEEM